MVQVQRLKFVAVVPPGVIKDNTSWTATAVDTKGWGHCLIVGQLGATDIAMAACKLTESDDDSSYSDVTGGDFSVSSTLPTSTDDNEFFGWDVKLTGTRKRYLKPTLTAGDGTAGTYLSVFAILSRGGSQPYTDSTRGLTADCLVI